jgi:hypothetical protein
MLARVDNDVLERFHCDTVLLNPPFNRLRDGTIQHLLYGP